MPNVPRSTRFNHHPPGLQLSSRDSASEWIETLEVLREAVKLDLTRNPDQLEARRFLRRIERDIARLRDGSA